MAIVVIFVLAMFVMCVLVSYSILMHDSSNKKKTSKKDRARQDRLYNFLYENFLTRKTFRKLVEQLASLSIYDFFEVRELAVRYFTQTVGYSSLLVLVGIIVFRDVFTCLLCLLYAVVVYHTLITKKLDAAHFQILKEFSIALTSIRETYTRLGNIPDAIGECRKGHLLQKAIDRIYLILTATDSEERLEDFYRTVPFPMLQTLAGVCYILNDAGDEVDRHGVSAFENAITLLESECDLEVRKLTKQKLMYNMLEYLPILPLPAVGLVELFVSSNMPGTIVIFKSLLGYVIRVALVLVSLVAYWYITNATSASTIRRNDRSAFVDALRFWPPFERFLNTILPKKAHTRLMISQMLRGALSAKDIKYIYTAKVLTTVVAFVATLSGLTIFTALAREATYNNVQVASLGGSSVTVEDAEKWMELDAYILAQPKAPRERDLQDVIPTYFPDISSTDLYDHAQRIVQKYNTYHSLKFHWWYVLVSYVAGLLGWYAPALMLDIRKRLVHAEEEEDVLQLQTMLAIIRYTKLDTMETLYWLAKQSRVYKTDLYFAYHEYPSDPELALNRLRDKSTVPEFQQICERLLSTISKVTIREAFADLESKRSQMLSIREMVQNAAIERKRRRCSPLSMAPLWLLIIGEFLVPIAILAYQQGSIILTQIGAI